MTAGDPIVQGASWYAGTLAPPAERPRLTFDLDVDVCVIGGGLAGLTTAREIARRGWSVAVIEARQIASGASGRNTGFVLPGFAEDLGRIIERVGLEQAKALWALSERGVDYVRKTIRETKMRGVKPENGWLNISKFRDDVAIEPLVRLMQDEFSADVDAWPRDKVREVLNSPFYHNAIHYPRAFSIHPLNYAFGLAAAAEQAGARIFERTPALSIDVAGIRKRIATSSARVRAQHIVLAANTGLGGLMPRIAASLLPITTYVITTAPLGARLGEVITYKGAVSDTNLADNHYRVVGGDRLMWSGGVTTWHTDPRRFARRLAVDISRTYPYLRKVEIDHVWSGTLGRPVHKMPQIGEFSRGLWIAGGFGGHGLNTTAMAGEIIARAIVEGDQTWRLFAPYDLVWAGGAFGRATAQVVYWNKRVGELVDAYFARRRLARSTADELPVHGSASAETQDRVATQDAGIAAPPPLPEDQLGPAQARPSRSKEKKKASKKAARRRRSAKKRAAASGSPPETTIVAPAAPAGEENEAVDGQDVATARAT